MRLVWLRGNWAVLAVECSDGFDLCVRGTYSEQLLRNVRQHFECTYCALKRAKKRGKKEETTGQLKSTKLSCINAIRLLCKLRNAYARTSAHFAFHHRSETLVDARALCSSFGVLEYTYGVSRGPEKSFQLHLMTKKLAEHRLPRTFYQKISLLKKSIKSLFFSILLLYSLLHVNILCVLSADEFE